MRRALFGFIIFLFFLTISGCAKIQAFHNKAKPTETPVFYQTATATDQIFLKPESEVSESGPFVFNVEEISLKDYFDSKSKNLLAAGLPQTIVRFSMRNISPETQKISMVKFFFLDEEGHRFFGTLLRLVFRDGGFENFWTLESGSAVSFEAVTEDYPIDPETAELIVTVIVDKETFGPYIADVHQKLDSERSAKEKTRRRKMDEFERGGKTFPSFELPQKQRYY